MRTSSLALAETLRAVESLETVGDISSLVNALATQKAQLQGAR